MRDILLSVIIKLKLFSALYFKELAIGWSIQMHRYKIFMIFMQNPMLKQYLLTVAVRLAIMT